MVGAGLDQVCGPGDDPGLGPSEELVAREGDEGGPRLDGLAGRGLVRQPSRRATGQPRCRRIEEPGAEVDHERRTERRELADVDGGREADDAVIRLVHLEHHSHVTRAATFVGKGALVVAPVGAVGRAHLDQACARLNHDVGNTEPAADLHQLAAGDEHVAIVRQRGQHEQHGSGTVVDDEGGLGAGRPGQQGGGVAPARAAPAGRQVELDVGVRRLLGVGDRRPPQVGVQEDAGGVHHWLQEVETKAPGPLAGRRRIARRNRSAGRVHEQRVRKADVGQFAGDGVDRRRTHVERISGPSCLSTRSTDPVVN